MKKYKNYLTHKRRHELNKAIREQIFELAHGEYWKFSSSLLPDRNNIIVVKIIRAMKYDIKKKFEASFY